MIERQLEFGDAQHRALQSGGKLVRNEEMLAAALQIAWSGRPMATRRAPLS